MDETGHVMYHPDISQIGKYAGTEKPELQKFIAESSVLSGEKLVYYYTSQRANQLDNYQCG